jgi:hypothetical protein
MKGMKLFSERLAVFLYRTSSWFCSDFMFLGLVNILRCSYTRKPVDSLSMEWLAAIVWKAEYRIRRFVKCKLEMDDQPVPLVTNEPIQVAYCWALARPTLQELH